jgi:hypothetical protein
MIMNGLSRRFIAGGVATAVLLAGCGSDGAEPDAADDTSDVTAQADGADDSDAGAQAEGDDGALDESAADEPEAARGDDTDREPLARVVHEVPHEEVTIAIEVLSMEVVGDLLRVGIEYTPSWAVEPASRVTLNSLLGGADGEQFSPRLLDPVNLLEYRTVRSPVMGGTSVSVTVDEPRLLYFYFGAPVQEPETLDLHLDFGRGTSDVPPLLDIPYAPAT